MILQVEDELIMISLPSLLTLAHLIGLALGVGSATAKLMLLLRCRTDPAFVSAYIAAARTLTRLIVVGMALLVLSGAGWLAIGYPLTTLLAVKLVLVASIFLLGPFIDNVVEPKFRALAPRPGEAASSGFIQIQRRYLLVELIATGLFYVIVVVWVLG